MIVRRIGRCKKVRPCSGPGRASRPSSRPLFCSTRKQNDSCGSRAADRRPVGLCQPWRDGTYSAPLAATLQDFSSGAQSFGTQEMRNLAPRLQFLTPGGRGSGDGRYWTRTSSALRQHVSPTTKYKNLSHKCITTTTAQWAACAKSCRSRVSSGTRGTVGITVGIYEMPLLSTRSSCEAYVAT